MPKVKLPSDGSSSNNAKKTGKNGLKQPEKKFKELFGDSGDEEKEVSPGFFLFETWNEYRTLVESQSKALRGGSGKGSGPTSSRSKVGSGPSAKQQADVSHQEDAGSTSASNPSASEVHQATERPKRACRLKRKHGVDRDGDFVGLSDGRSTTPVSLDSFSNSRNGIPAPAVGRPLTGSLKRKERSRGSETPSTTASSEFNWDMEVKQFYKGKSSGVVREGGASFSGGSRKRGVRCGECSACRQKDDCGKCIMCKDKKKFGGPGVKKQACIYRKCQNLIREMPLKCKPKRPLLPEDFQDGPSVKRPKRLSKSPPVELVSAYTPALLKPTKPTAGGKGGRDRNTDGPPTVQIIWPEEPSLSGLPLYSLRESVQPRPSVCLKCGSAGKMEMLRCAVCCNVFHTFCVDVDPQLLPTTTGRRGYTCPSCIYCEVCGKEAKNNCVRCTDCKKCYHKTCLSDHRSHAVSNLWRCVSCTHCTSCKTASPGNDEGSVWYDDYKYCAKCYELKEKGNFCPLCQVCYSDNDYDSKMMQCVKCDHWVHTHCEDMTDQSYEVLGVVPESVEFLCKLCGTKEDRVKLLEDLQDYVRDSYVKLVACVSRVVKHSVKLGEICQRTTTTLPDLPLVADFHSEVKAVLTKVLSQHKMSSVVHKMVANCQKEYLLEVDTLFPWLEEQSPGGEGLPVAMDVIGGHAPLPAAKCSRVENSVPVGPIEFPTAVSHDHTYMSISMETTQLPGATLHRQRASSASSDSSSSDSSSSSSSSSSTSSSVASNRNHASCGPPEDSVATCAEGVTDPGVGVALPEAVPPASNEGEDTSRGIRDTRRCVLCQHEGDASCEESGRLVPCGVEDWVHVNCAIWSAEVYEEQSGILRCAHTAINRGARMRCEVCKETGATVGCCTSSCSANYHFQCARNAKCVFLTSKQVFCHAHRDNAQGIAGAEVLPEAEFTVMRQIYVDSNPQRTSRKVPRTLEAAKAKVQLGSVQVQNLGSLVEFSQTPQMLIPNQYRASCEFWDVDNPSSITTYSLTVTASHDDDWLLPTPPSKRAVDRAGAAAGETEMSMSSAEVTLNNGDRQSPLPWDILREVAAEPPKKRQKMAATAKPPVLAKKTHNAVSKCSPPSTPKITEVASKNPVNRCKNSPSVTPVPNAAFPIESASNLLLYLKSNGSSGLNHFIQNAAKPQDSQAQKAEGAMNPPPVSLKVLIPTTTVAGTDPITSLMSTIEAIQSPSNQSFLNQLIASATAKQQVLNCTLNPTNIKPSTATAQPSSNLPTNAIKSFPNASAVKNFKIPKKKPATVNSPKPSTVSNRPRPAPSKPPEPKSVAKPAGSSRPTASPRPVELPKVIDSVEAVARSICLKRKRCGLSTTPCGLQFTIKNAVGKEWLSYDLEELWSSILSELQEKRVQCCLPYIPHNRSVHLQFGLSHPLVIQMIEQLCHANRCDLYSFSYHRPQSMSSWRDHRPKVNLSGCARTEGYSGVRSPPDMFSFLRSDLRPPKPQPNLMEVAIATGARKEVRANAGSRLPYGMQYRALQKVYKNYVGVFKSNLHGLGLFCTKEIESGQMVIEYSGDIIRKSLADPKERFYESRNIGCYMFGIDNHQVVDATMAGNEARFINHSCEPNCYSRIITVDGKKKIMIFAMRRLVVGEELTYDYKFPFEDISKKIPCHCGSRRCRKYLN